MVIWWCACLWLVGLTPCSPLIGCWPLTSVLLITGSDVGLVCSRGCKVGPDQLQLVSGASTWAPSQKRDRGHSQGDWALARVPANVVPWVIWIWWPEQVCIVKSSFGDKFYEESTTMATAQQPTLTSSKNLLLIVAELCWIFIIS